MLRLLIFFVFMVHTSTFSYDSLLTVKNLYDNGSVKVEFHKDSTGRLHGPYTSFYPSGRVKLKGNYVNSKQDGKWYFYNEDGSLDNLITYSEGNVADDKTLPSTFIAGNSYGPSSPDSATDHVKELAFKVSRLQTEVKMLSLSPQDRQTKPHQILFGVLQVGIGAAGAVLTIADANETYKLPGAELTVSNKWSKIHTVCLIVSISSIISGIAFVAN